MQVTPWRWAPTDLVSDADLTAYEAKVLTSFNVTDWAEKRRRALEDWLAPILRAQGFDLARLKTRFEPDSTLGYTASAQFRPDRGGEGQHGRRREPRGHLRDRPRTMRSTSGRRRPSVACRSGCSRTSRRSPAHSRSVTGPTPGSR